jgi:hypothetical protein
MKLYTEEQVKTMLIKTDKFTPLHIEHLMNEIRPIELPSDEEIISENQLSEFNSEDQLSEFNSEDVAYYNGAKWMRDKIEGGNK